MTATLHIVAAHRPLRLGHLVASRGSRWLRLLIWPILGLAAVASIAFILVVTGDYRPMVVNSDSMRPALEAGDVIVNEVVPPSEVHVGDIVAYSDEMRGGAVITERVVAVREEAGAYSFTTTADSSSRVEEWSIDAAGRVGRVAYRAPGLGRWLETRPIGLFGALLVAGVTALLVAVAFRPFRSAF